MVSKASVRVSARDLHFRDLDHLTAGEIHYHPPGWDIILQGHNNRDEILCYLKFWVDVCDFFLPFKGSFQGTYYSSAFPHSVTFSNTKSCAGFENFISDTILIAICHSRLFFFFCDVPFARSVSSFNFTFLIHLALVWSNLLCLQRFTVGSFFPQFCHTWVLSFRRRSQFFP